MENINTEQNITSDYMIIKMDNYKNISLTPNEGYDSVLIFLHGLGGSAKNYLDLFSQSTRPIPKKMKVILLTAPESPVTIKNQALLNSWYDVRNLQNEIESRSQKDVIENSKIIIDAIEKEAETQEIKNDFTKIFLGGFSQGCCMSLYILNNYEKNLGGIIGLSGLLFPFCELNESKRNIPIMLSHGENDKIIPYRVFIEVCEKFTKGGFNLIMHKFKGGHMLENTALEKMRNFFRVSNF